MKTLLFVALGLFAALHVVNLARYVWVASGASDIRPGWLQLAIGFVTNFFDALGIGNFAPTASAYRLLKLVPDEGIPGTMNVGHTLPVIVMAFLFITLVEVEPVTLVTMIAASILGAWLGAGIVSGLPRRGVQLGMGGALLAAALLLTMSQLQAFPVGGTALGLRGGSFVIGVGVALVLGALMTIGVGFYAPCMIAISLLGMEPKASFPIMMGACAFLMPVASARFLRHDRLNLRAALGLTLGGVPAVFLAVWIVKSLPLEAVRWLVVGIAVYTAVTMLRAAKAGPKS